MNILVIVELYFHKSKSGGEAYLHNFLKKLKFKYSTNTNIQVIIPNLKEDKKYNFEDIIINESIDKTEDLKNYILKSDLVITQLMLSEKIINMCLECKKEIIWILHGYFDGFNKLMKNDNIIKIFNSNNVLMDFMNNSKYKIKNYFIIYPFTDFIKLSKYKDIEKNRREYITFINPVKNKGVNLILKLAKQNKNRKFLIVEGGYSKEEQLQYLNKFRELSNCHIIKNTNDIINNIYLKSRIIIMPSKYESYGLCVAEACCFGIPCIINKCTKGLVENLGELSLGGKDEVVKTYQKVIQSLDIKENYFMWSNYYFEIAEERYNEILYQYDYFFKKNFDYGGETSNAGAESSK